MFKAQKSWGVRTPCLIRQSMILSTSDMHRSATLWLYTLNAHTMPSNWNFFWHSNTEWAALHPVTILRFILKLTLDYNTSFRRARVISSVITGSLLCTSPSETSGITTAQTKWAQRPPSVGFRAPPRKRQRQQSWLWLTPAWQRWQSQWVTEA